MDAARLRKLTALSSVEFNARMVRGMRKDKKPNAIPAESGQDERDGQDAKNGRAGTDRKFIGCASPKPVPKDFIL